MANTPIEIDVPTLVADRIGRFSGVSIRDLAEELTLMQDLAMKHPPLVQLAESLRLIVKVFNKNGTVLVTDLENDSATVGSAIRLVEDRIKE
jgi:hypothetical protein